MKFFGAVILFLIAFVAVLLLFALAFVRQLFIRIRQHITGDYDDETVRRMSDKYYRGEGEGPQFDKNYFKGGGTTKGSGTNSYKRKRSQQQSQAQTTTTSEGVTIIDQRQQHVANRKIFNNDEGEYVDFVEEN